MRTHRWLFMGLVAALVSGAEADPRDDLCAVLSARVMNHGFDAVYQHRDGNPKNVRIVGYDGVTGAYYFIANGTPVGVNAAGKNFRLGKDRKIEEEEPSKTLDRIVPTWVEQYTTPSLLLREICRTVPDALAVERSGDGGYVVRFTMPGVYRMWLQYGVPEGTVIERVAHTMWTDSTGLVRRHQRGETRAIREVEYDPSSVGRIPVSTVAGSDDEWSLASVRGTRAGKHPALLQPR